jgi:hypothetical protein
MVRRIQPLEGFMRVIATIVMISFVQCGLFDPRPSETPIGGVFDPLNFSGILQNTNEQFKRMQFEELFVNNGFIYEDKNSGINPKSMVIQILRQIVNKYQNIKVEWVPGTVWQNAKLDTMILSDLHYRIFLNTAGTVPDDSGGATFTVAKETYWQIVEWQDFPGKSTPSFFATTP